MAAPARSSPRSAGGAPRAATLPLRRSLKPSPERRPGGPARPAPKPAPPRPRRRRPATRGRGTRLGNRIRSIRPGVLADRLLRGRLWVPLIAVLLTGIVFLNVALLEVNGSIARMDTRSAEQRRDNAALRMRVARLGSSERIQRSAAGRGFVPVVPGEVGYLSARPGDAPVAARALERWPAPRPRPEPASAESGTDPASSASAAGASSAGTAETASGTSVGDPSTAGETPSDDPTDSAASETEPGAGAGTATP